MRRRTAAALAVLALLLAAGCAAKQQEEGGVQLYFVDAAGKVGSAIRSESFGEQRLPSVNSLVNALLQGPSREGLRGFVPRGVTLRGYKLEEGLLTVDLSENYGDLSGVELTLADYCITLTLCQLEEVDAVRITAAGHELNYRAHQVFTPEEVVQSGLLERDTLS